MKQKIMIYFDNSATTPVDKRVSRAMRPFFEENFGNASSLHQPGLDARVAVDRSQKKVADFLGASKDEIFFTSGATESNNLAILGQVRHWQRKNKKNIRPHIITSQIEHDAVLEPIRQLVKEGAEATFLPVGKNGVVDIKELKKAVKPNTILISVMYVNNEIGTIQPIAEIGQLILRLNKSRKNRIFFHTDATQALNYCDCRTEILGVDLLSLSAHKIYGPKGIGALYVKRGTPLEPIIFGGHQQNSVRPGTYNVPGIVGLGRAVEILADHKENEKEKEKIKTLRDQLIAQVKKNITGVIINGDQKKRVPGNANFIFDGVEGESVVLALSEKGIAVSTGSACSSGSLDPSHVLTAIGLPPEKAHGSLRVTLGRFNTKNEIGIFVRELKAVIARLRKMSPI